MQQAIIVKDGVIFVHRDGLVCKQLPRPVAERVRGYNSACMDALASKPEYLPPIPPAGYHLFAWCGAMLVMPREWNLCRYEGNHRRGGLVFADLAAPRLFVRWQARKRRFGKLLSDPIGKAIAGFTKRVRNARIERISDRATWVLLPEERLLLAANEARVYELRWPKETSACDPDKDPLVRSFLHAVEHPFPSAAYWDVYGAKAVFHADARWKQISLKPGAPRLTLTYGSLVHMSGAFSMADRLLMEGALRGVAKRLLHLGELTGEWGGNECLTWFTGKVRRRWMPWFRVPFHFNVMNDPRENRICWELTTSRAFLRIWRP